MQKIKLRIYRSRLDAISIFPKCEKELFSEIANYNLEIESNFSVGNFEFFTFKNSKNYAQIETKMIPNKTKREMIIELFENDLNISVDLIAMKLNTSIFYVGRVLDEYLKKV
jgi:hypothetical protein